MISDYGLPPLSRTECAWHDPWFIARMTQVGERHYLAGHPMDDCHVVGHYASTVWLAVADGVSGAPLGRVGSRAACRTVNSYLGRQLSASASLTEDLLKGAFKQVHETLQNIAAKEKRSVIDYSTTLAVAVINGSTVVAASIGDSSILAYGSHDIDGVSTPMFYPFCSGPQYASASRSHVITQPDWGQKLATRCSASPHVEGIVLATDGANNSFLDVLQSGHPFDPRLIATLSPAVDALTPRYLSNYFAQHMKEVTEDNDDDRTLLVAWKPPRSLAPPPPQPRTL